MLSYCDNERPSARVDVVSNNIVIYTFARYLIPAVKQDSFNMATRTRVSVVRNRLQLSIMLIEFRDRCGALRDQ